MVFKKIKFDELFEFLNKNFYKIFKIGVLRRGSIKIAIESNYKEIPIREFFECKFKDDFKDVFNKVRDFIFERLKRDGYYLVDVDGRDIIITFFKFVKFCERHEDIKKLYILFDNNEYKIQKIMDKEFEDFLRCKRCKNGILAIENFGGGVNFEFMGFELI